MYLLETLAAPVAATGVLANAWWMIAIPAVVAGILLLGGRMTDQWGPYVATAAVWSSFGIAAASFIQLWQAPAAARVADSTLYTWFSVGNWTVDVGFRVDTMSILFALLVTGVGGLIHVYSIGYMEHDPNKRKFFAFLNLFIAAMLLLVLADSYLILFVGWEGVGLASYLLISFWQERPAAAAAGMKAFVMNRVGDVGMLLAIFSMLHLYGSTKFAVIDAQAAQMSPLWATLIGFFLLLAACGKSAQVPLQAWLLDAMEGPTPVSALIHAATMVTAGVYLVVRSHSIYELSPTAQSAVVVVGTVTLLAGAWIGTTKDDIKKVLAGSTMSQIGYMMLAAGLGPVGYAFAIFHLITHGAFKANMFLGAGSVMHGMNDDVNMRHFGGLAKFMPVTFWTFAMGYLAIIGLPPLSGYFSKDHIIEAAFSVNTLAGVCALLGAGVTAFYMTRLMKMTFHGTKRWLPGVEPHESPAVMTVPLILLALLSVGLGAAMNGWIQSWLAPAVGNHVHDVSLIPTPIGWLTMAVVAVGIIAGVAVYSGPIPAQPDEGNVLVRIGRNDLYGDAINDAVVVRPTYAAAAGAEVADRRGIDGAINGLVAGFAGLSGLLRRTQSGYVRSYALTMVLGIVAVGGVLILALIG